MGQEGSKEVHKEEEEVSLSKLNARASHGSGSKGSLSSLTRRTHKGSGSKGTTRTLTAGTSRTGQSPFPSMARGPLR